MTAKEKLAEHVETLTEDEAALALELLGLPGESEWPDFPPASPKVMEMFERAMADSQAGRVHSTEEARKRLGLS